VSATDDLLRNNERYAASFAHGALARDPARKLAIVTCMDARIDPLAVLGLRVGDANVLRNAGGVVTDHELRAIAVSQRLLGTEEIIVIGHTECGMLGFDEEAFRRAIADEVGEAPTWAGPSLTTVEDGVRASLERVRTSPFLRHTDRVRGFVYDVATGRLREVE